MDAKVEVESDGIPPLVVALITEDYEQVDPRMPKLLQVISKHGADEIWHKHGSFKHHLHGVWRILKIWGQPDAVCDLGLFHSSYSNSYVAITLFQPDVDRSVLRDLIGEEAERLVHTFCIIPRQDFIFKHVLGCEATGIPAEGLVLPHIRTGEDVHLSRHDVGVLILASISDFFDQWTGWYDVLFNNDGNMQYQHTTPLALWPGNGKPGLILNWMSRLAQMAVACGLQNIPPIFNHCTEVISVEDERKSVDIYWQVVTATPLAHTDPVVEASNLSNATSLLLQARQLNPYVGEIPAVLAQLYASQQQWDQALQSARTALQLFLGWGCAWDKRMSWEAWIAWCRVSIRAAKAREWPRTAFGIVNLGMVH
eukprot:TRINITY_DN8736_c0_g1_i2.p1 TRINITY_DN8736_c0_g1~~TRINITY_DN8736_c0_g1_i2.p1  ORF type:complete len:368 (+),score=53.82 TRINITY_DN8736_c0_g1_i2:66-1169(+)